MGVQSQFCPFTKLEDLGKFHHFDAAALNSPLLKISQNFLWNCMNHSQAVQSGARNDPLDYRIHCRTISNMAEMPDDLGVAETETWDTEEDRFLDERSKASAVQRTQACTPIELFQSPAAQQPMRRRLDTEETYRHRNIMSPAAAPQSTVGQSLALAIDNSIQLFTDISLSQYDLEPQTNDDDTVVSSLSNDEDSLAVARRHATLTAIIEKEQSTQFSQRSMAPPVEVAILTNKEDQRESLMENLVSKLAIRQHSPPLVLTRGLTGGPSYPMERPTLGRNRSCPVTMDFSVASSNMSTRSSTASIPEDAIIINGTVVEGVRHRNGDMLGASSKHSALLGTRKRRVHRRCHTGTEISVGSIVGQSTLLTSVSATSNASVTDSEASSVKKALRSAHTAEEMMLSYSGAGDGIACCQVRRHKNLVREELKYVAGRLTSPIRLLPMFKEKKAELKRAKGSLV